jgi:hypothetical protein
MMPTVNCGGGPWTPTSASNFSAFLDLACSGTESCTGGLDTALTYGVKTQEDVGKAIRDSGFKASVLR